MAPSVLLSDVSHTNEPDTITPTAIPMNGAKPIDQKTEQPALLHRSLDVRPYTVVNAEGSYLELEDGRKILDACGGAAVAIIGHGNQEVAHAAMEQMSKVSYVHTLTYTTDSAEDLAKYVLKPESGSGYNHGLVKAFFVGSGSEANDAGMKCARQYWFEKGETRRQFYVARRQGYHGNTIGAMSVSGIPSRKVPYQDIILPNVSLVSPADTYHSLKEGETEEELAERLVRELENEFMRIGPENVISFVAETVVGAALGCMAAPKGYWPAVRTLCDKHGILLHLDEVMCGMGRTGTYFAFEQEDIQPDIVTIGKGLGGGYAPVAGMLINQRIVDGLKSGTSAFNHGHTYQAHPVSCAIALSVQTIVKRDRLIGRVGAMGSILKQLLKLAFAGCEYVGDIRGRGFFWALEFMRDKERRQPFPRSVGFASRLQHTAFMLGVAVYPCPGTVDGFEGDHVLIAPPYTISEAELWTTVTTLRKAYDATAEYVKSVVL